eukprot:Seg91.7 transcript_id=Seg91.7/GoldUCD/mRNA.D3Y31 product="Xanthine dehydrogenase" protein_id=Seg91.7/GoldUCD/D3Y31
MDELKEINLTVNGKEYKIVNPRHDIFLSEWLRDSLYLKGLKTLCHEGGCGSCVVSICKDDPVAKPESIMAVNSCLQPIAALDGCHILTVEGLGSKKDGYHAIQEKFAENFASQCGFCTPGFIMNGFSLLASGSNGKSQEEIEKNIDGNICRCTGYRPILDAMKSFAKESCTLDIEDIRKHKSCTKNCTKAKPQVMTVLSDDSTKSLWYNPTSLLELHSTLSSINGKPVKIVAGNTGIGIYKNEESFAAYVCLKGVKELSEIKVLDKLVEFGSNVSLSQMIKCLEVNKEKSKSFDAMVEHLEKVAGCPIRNVATWAGNLMLIHKDQHFPSDVFVILSTVGATLEIAGSDGSITKCGMDKFLSFDMKSKIILSITVPFSNDSKVVQTYKIMPRKQNSYAYVNAGFYASFDKEKLAFKGKPRIIVGGLGLKMTRVEEVERFLEEKVVTDSNVFSDAVKLLCQSLKPNPENKLVNFEYCKNVAKNLFYKFFVSLCGGNASPRSLSAIQPCILPISSGEQSFHVTEDENSAVNKPFMRIEGKQQAAGEAQYIGDIPKYQNEVAAAFVLSTVGSAALKDVDASEAKKHPGFVAFYTAKDVPGRNNWLKDPNCDEIMASKEIGYHGQPVGLVVADSPRNAEKIAKLVKVEYENVERPITTLKEAIEKEKFHRQRFPGTKVGDTEEAFKTSDHVIEGEIGSGAQHNFYIEPQTCLVVPEDIGFKVFSSTQCSRGVQETVAKTLGINASSVDVHVPRIGGGFGGKIEYPNKIASAVAVAASALNRPVRMVMSLNDNLKVVGKRSPFLTKYKVGFSKDGHLQAIDLTIYTDAGFNPENADGFIAGLSVDNAYFCPNWNISVIDCKTNTPFNTFVRAPGHVQAYFISETILDQVASFLGRENRDEIKEINLYKDGQVALTLEISDCLLTSIWNDMKQRSEYDRRSKEISQFNKENRWRKRGISMMPIRYVSGYFTFNFTALVSIYYADGTVAVSSGGIEMGQGMNTRICQVAANQLKIPMNMITIKHHSSITSPNCSTTGGSLASEINCLAVYKCCEMLNERLKPIKEKLPDASWQELIAECNKQKVDLSAKYMFFAPEKARYAYTTYGAACSEVEIDVLTGEHHILRSDIVFDCGESVNPRLDVGQLEGAFVMTLGYWFSEKIVYDEETGEQFTTGTWNYKPPMSKDIPNDLRIHLNHEAVNPIGFVRSKAVGEPGCCMASTALFATKRAIEAARSELGFPAEYFRLDGPATIDKIQSLCLVQDKDLIL